MSALSSGPHSRVAWCAQTPPDARAALPSNDGKPKDAASAIIAAFEAYQVVGVGAAHGAKDLDDFLLSLIRHPAFPTAVNDIVVECGNSRYQAVLDRYIAGDTVALSEVRQVWRNTTQNMCSTSAFYEELFPLVREVNRRLPSTKRLRVLAGDSPIDWHVLNGPTDGAAAMPLLFGRDSNVAAVMESEVYAGHRKALMLYGEQHLFHGVSTNAIGRLEAHHPGTTFVVYTHASLGCDVPSATENDAIEARLATGPVPSLTRIKGMWLAEVPTPSPRFRVRPSPSTMPFSTLARATCCWPKRFPLSFSWTRISWTS